MIYLDNSATTYPKPPEVRFAVHNAIRSYGFNPGRGGYKQSLTTAQRVYDARETVSAFFHAPSAENVIFTPSCTQALNTVIKGVLTKGDHVVISSLEHNAVARTVHHLQKAGIITYSVADVVIGNDEQTIENFREAINPRTKLFICTQASNVFGFRLPTERLCALAHSYRILFCLDAAQTAGLFRIDMQADGYDFVCCAGHKYLYGPMGIGLLLLGNDMMLAPLTDGGTGSASAELLMPDFYPDRLEAGTLNLPGILGLQAGIQYVRSKNPEHILIKEKKLIRELFRQLSDYRYIRLFADADTIDNAAPVLSFTAEDADSETVVRYLSEKYDIAVRGGLHCAPLAHRMMGTLDSGTVRISPSVFTTSNDIRVLLHSLKKYR
ncbi:aminotransferase class V-fold PLP-dependent enzyme [Ruminococcus sp.]|uniref:aminotransferase class V-fold PLP-dependent enzyme n=1 Tax=Ruminococcus sp. TaxID=41978 RepID=UPI00388D367B